MVLQTPPPSPWIQRWTEAVPNGGPVLDVACGSGRHLRWFAQHGHRVWGIDRDTDAARQQCATLTSPQTALIEADIENGPWPLIGSDGPQKFAAVVVTNYLWRPLFPVLMASLAPGGLLLYETFAVGNAAFGKPSRPAFLLAPGELLQLCNGLHIIAYEHGVCRNPDKMVQRIAAMRPVSPYPASADAIRCAL